MMVGNVNCMRRREDSWLNATQILKIAGVEKGKRTKVLEKEILNGKHEKVQGGYGKYQGTWIEYERGRAFCQQYGVEDILRPLLDYNMGIDGDSKGMLDTPTKEQAMAAQRKKQMYQGTENRISAQSPNGTFFKNISASAASAVQAINKARFDSPSSRPGSAQQRRPGLARSHSSQKDSFQNGSQHSMQSIHTDGSFGANLDPSLGNVPNPYLSQTTKRPASALGDSESPRKRMRPSSQGGSQGMNGRDMSMDLAAVNGSFHVPDDTTQGIPPLPQPTSAASLKKQTLLMSLMEEHADFSNHSTFDQVTGPDLDIPMDDKAHTALIWASTLGRLPLVRRLVSGGANIRRVNVGGETALMRAASAVNNYDNQTFPELLEVLGSTIDMRDGRGRTVLHHIAIASAIKGRNRACKYYLESLLEFVVRQGSGPSSTQNSFANGIDSSQGKNKTIGLARFMSEIVNSQDISGDTALNMAARNGNRALAQQLLEVGANPSIANGGGLKPTDFGVEGLHGDMSADVPTSQDTAHGMGSMGPPAKKLNNRVADTGIEVLNSMSAIIEDAKSSYLAESRAKQALIDEARAKLQATREHLASEKARLADLRRKRDARQDLQTQIVNLQKANHEKRLEVERITHAPPRLSVKLGDADSGLWIDAKLLPPKAHLTNGQAFGEDAMVIDGDLDDEDVDLSTLTTDQKSYATRVLANSHHLNARTAAYRANNDNLKTEIKRLQQRSGTLEQKLKRILSLSMEVPENKIEGMLESLIVATESEQGDIDPDRIREFLRKVKADDGEDTDVNDE